MSAVRVLRAGGLWFDGIDDYVSVPRSPSLNLSMGLTLMARVYAVRWPPQYCILDRNGYYAIGFYGGRMWSWLRLPTTVRGSPTSRNLNTWYHIAVTYDGVTRKHYVNGSLDGSWVENAPLEVYDSVRLIIGANANDSDRAEAAPSGFFNGIIDDVRIYNRALTADEIGAIYERGALIRDGLVLHLDFSEYEGNIAYDKSGCGNHATLYGARWVVKKALYRM